MGQPVWYGTQGEAVMLTKAIASNCTCEFNAAGCRLSTCGAHQMLLQQRALNGLLFVRTIRQRFVREEWMSEVEPALFR